MSGVAIDQAPIARPTPTSAIKNTAMLDCDPLGRPARDASGEESLVGSARLAGSSGVGAKAI